VRQKLAAKGLLASENDFAKMVSQALKEAEQITAQKARQTAQQAARTAAEKAARERAAREAAQQAQQQAARAITRVESSNGSLVIQGAGTHGQDAVARSASGRGFAAVDGVSGVAGKLKTAGKNLNEPPTIISQRVAQIMDEASLKPTQQKALEHIQDEFARLHQKIVQDWADDMGASVVSAAGVDPQKEILYIAQVGDAKAYSLSGARLKELGTPVDELRQWDPVSQSYQPKQIIGVSHQYVEGVAIKTYPTTAGGKYFLSSDGIEKIINRDPRFQDQIAQILAQATDPITAQNQIMTAAINKSRQIFSGRMPDDLSLIVFFTR
jgi:serine/threonine protein phosphatase PrpC